MADEKDFMGSLTDEERAEIDAASEEETTATADETTEASSTDTTAEAAAGEQETTADETQEEAEQPELILPPLRARVPDNAEELINAISSEEDALAQKFDDGDITAREYREAMNKLNAQREEVNWNKRKADLAREMEDQAKANAWQREVQDFMTTKAANIAKSRAAMVAFDEVVKKVTSDPANLTLSDRAQLDKAYKLFMDDMSGSLGLQAPTPAQPKQAQQPAAKSARNIPPTLARVPAAESEYIDGGKFAALDRLAAMDPAGYEAAVAKMSEAERAQFESVV